MMRVEVTPMDLASMEAEAMVTARKQVANLLQVRTISLKGMLHFSEYFWNH